MTGKQLDVDPKVYSQVLPRPGEPQVTSCPKCGKMYPLTGQPEQYSYSQTVRVSPSGDRIWEHKCGAFVVFKAPIF